VFRHDWGLSNPALAIDDLAARPLTSGIEVSTDF
jgi:hypothetical protein